MISFWPCPHTAHMENIILGGEEMKPQTRETISQLSVSNWSRRSRSRGRKVEIQHTASYYQLSKSVRQKFSIIISIVKYLNIEMEFIF